MITKDLKITKMCLFSASEYHLEMILLPYIKNRIEKENFYIITQNDLSKTLENVLERVNFNDDLKDKIKNLHWDTSNTEDLENSIFLNENRSNIIINGEYNFIKQINEKLNNKKIYNVNIIDCFNIDDIDVNMEKIALNYENILNTQKL